MLAAQDLSFAFGDRAVLDRVSLVVEPGRRVALIGPNGAGKSTLLRLLGGHLRPTAGSATYGGEPVSRVPPARRARHLAYVPQATSLAFPFSVARFVAFGRHALSMRDADRAAAEALERVGLLDRAGDPLGELSQGQQQRASIARALCQLSGMPNEGRVLLADEPTASLDPAHDLVVRDLLAELAQAGVGVAASLHDLASAAAFDTIVLLSDGGAVLDAGEPEAVLAGEPLGRAFGAAFRTHRDESGRIAAVSADHSR